MSNSITVTLTGPQTAVVRDAIMYYLTVLDDMIEADHAGALRQANTLMRAHERISQAAIKNKEN